jgi:ATP-dependent exoDNAse (exonuclease V) beta subunit
VIDARHSGNCRSALAATTLNCSNSHSLLGLTNPSLSTASRALEPASRALELSLSSVSRTLEQPNPESNFRRSSFSPRIYSPMNPNPSQSHVEPDTRVPNSPRTPNPHVRKAITPYTLREGRANKQKTHQDGDKFAPEDRPKTSPNGSWVSTSLRRSPLAAAVSSLG